MVHSIAPAKTREEHRWLRVTTVLAFLPAFALLLPYGIITAKPLPTVGIAPMFFSAAFSTLVLGGGVRSPGMRACFDLLLATSILAVLLSQYVEDGSLSQWPFRDARLTIPSWLLLSQNHDSEETLASSTRTSGDLL